MSGHTGRPDSGEYNPYYDTYISLVPPGDVVSIMASQLNDTLSLLAGADGDRRYADDKWTIREVIGHISDTERIMAYRALRVARGDATPLPSFEQNDYVPAAEFGSRSLENLIDELVAVRAATVSLFEGLPATAWTRLGTASQSPISVRALACIIAGHELHHRTILAERYLRSN